MKLREFSHFSGVIRPVTSHLPLTYSINRPKFTNMRNEITVYITVFMFIP